MKGVSKEQIAQAKQIDLLSYLKACEPQNLQAEGPHDYRHKAFHTLIVSDNGKWNWTDHDVGGTTALNYLIKVLGQDFVPSVRQLNAMQGRSDVSFQPVQKSPQSEKAEFHLPPADENVYAVNRYLRGRGIHPCVIHHCKAQGILYQTTFKTGGSSFENCVFVGKDKNGTPRSASLRGCQGKFRKETMGSRKCFPFFIAADRPTTVVEVYEAPVDAMSGASLHLMNHDGNWHEVHYLSLGGLNFLAMDGFLETHPEITTIRLCLDNDEPGRKFTERMVERYGGERQVEDAPPPMGKDYNDSLMAYLAEYRQRTRNVDDILEL